MCFVLYTYVYMFCISMLVLLLQMFENRVMYSEKLILFNTTIHVLH